MRTFSSTRPATIMEVCGTHTHELFRTGIRFSLPDWVKLVSGPGCPVCVTDDRDLARVILMAKKYDLTIITFGDMVKVPTPLGSLATLRSEGKKVQVVYSPVDAVKYAMEHKDETCVFFAVGFETTMPAVAAAIQDRETLNAKNLFFMVNHKRLVPALQVLFESGRVNIDGLLLPGHVSAIIGASAYKPILSSSGIPGVVTGFSKDQMLRGIKILLKLIVNGEFGVINAYPEVVREDGNEKAQLLISSYFEVGSGFWRGLGFIPSSAMVLKKEFSHLDAQIQFPVEEPQVSSPPGCRCAEVVLGAADPASCPLFASACTPQNPVGPCMVSSEGACAAWFRYGGANLHG